MSSLLEQLTPKLEGRFPDRGLARIAGDHPHLRFPAIHPDVGDVEIFEEGDEFIVVYGVFTHTHYRKQAVETLIADLDALFRDRLRMHGSHADGGGIVREDEESYCSELGIPEYVWSGPANDAARNPTPRCEAPRLEERSFSLGGEDRERLEVTVEATSAVASANTGTTTG